MFSLNFGRWTETFAKGLVLANSLIVRLQAYISPLAMHVCIETTLCVAASTRTEIDSYRHLNFGLRFVRLEVGSKQVITTGDEAHFGLHGDPDHIAIPKFRSETPCCHCRTEKFS